LLSRHFRCAISITTLSSYIDFLPLSRRFPLQADFLRHSSAAIDITAIFFAFQPIFDSFFIIDFFD
jgi:hypothetical protein